MDCFQEHAPVTGSTKMKQVFHIPDPVYGYDLSLFVGSYPAFRAYYKRVHGLDVGDQDGLVGGSFWAEHSTSGRVWGLVLWIEKWDGGISDLGNLMHECIHRAMGTMGLVGVPVSCDSNEAMVRYAEYLYCTALRKLQYDLH